MFVARHRLIDGDEGFYLLASRRILEHKVPYLEFFYPQAPLLPYAYGLWIKLFGISWFSARSFSAALTTVIGLLIYDHVCKETRKRIAGAAAIILFASSTFIFAWFPVVKTYSLTALFLFGAYAIVTRLSSTPSPWMVGLAGLLLGLSVDTRSYVVGLLPIFVLWIFCHPATRGRLACVRWFLAGFAIGILPCLYLLIVSPDQFLFNNFGYHAMRSGTRPVGNWSEKLRIARQVLGGPGTQDDNGAQFSILSAVSLVTILASRAHKSAAFLAFSIAFVLGLISILPTPAYTQYFCLCVPFLVVAAVNGASNYITSLQEWQPKCTAAVASVVLLVIFVSSSVPSFRRYLVTGDRVPGVKGAYDAPNWTLDQVSALSNAIDEVAAPNEQIVSFWPGYIFATKADSYPGLSGHPNPAI
jgi:4-amino-4-deoxy-L-arabinose transferase-like glycosyltransferase